MSWEKDFKNYSRIVIDDLDKPITISKSCKIFLSCGDRDNESEVAQFLKLKMELNSGVFVYFWGQNPPSSMPHRSTPQDIEGEIKRADIFISILHKRELMGNGLFSSSVPVQDEMKWAIQKGNFLIGFREEGVAIEGMILPEKEIRKVKNSSEMIDFLQQKIDEWFRNHPSSP